MLQYSAKETGLSVEQLSSDSLGALPRCSTMEVWQSGNAAVLKTVTGKTVRGSNPLTSAMESCQSGLSSTFAKGVG